MIKTIFLIFSLSASLCYGEVFQEMDSEGNVIYINEEGVVTDSRGSVLLENIYGESVAKEETPSSTIEQKFTLNGRDEELMGTPNEQRKSGKFLFDNLQIGKKPTPTAEKKKSSVKSKSTKKESLKGEEKSHKKGNQEEEKMSPYRRIWEKSKLYLLLGAFLLSVLLVFRKKSSTKKRRVK